MSKPTPKQAKINSARRAALNAALQDKSEASSTSLATSYGLPIAEVRAAMRAMGVNDNG